MSFRPCEIDHIETQCTSENDAGNNLQHHLGLLTFTLRINVG